MKNCKLCPFPILLQLWQLIEAGNISIYKQKDFTVAEPSQMQILII